VIIMTRTWARRSSRSNAGEKNYTKMKSAVMEGCSRASTEFINRIDDIVVFTRSARARSAIVDIQPTYLRKRLAERNMDLTLDDAARDLLGRRASIRCMAHGR